MKKFMVFFSGNKVALLLSLGMAMLSTAIVYANYLEYYTTKYTHNYVILNNVEIRFKGPCEEYNDNQNTLCSYNIKGINKNIKLPQGKADNLVGNKNLTFFIKFSELRHVMYVQYPTMDVTKPIETLEIKREIAGTSRYITYCNTYNIPYCKE